MKFLIRIGKSPRYLYWGLTLRVESRIVSKNGQKVVSNLRDNIGQSCFRFGQYKG